VRSVTLPGAAEGLRFLFKPDFSKINAGVILSALGQAAFSLSIGMGAMITYGSYIGKDNNLSKTAFQVSIADLFIAVLAGIAIFPAVFAFNISPSEGTGLVFIVLPNIFQQMLGGYFFAIMFFILLFIAALTSSISILEVVVAFCTEQFKLKRRTATIAATLLISIVGVLSTLSFSKLSFVKIFKLSIFDSLDFFSANILLPLGALLIVLFLGWFYPLHKTKEEISNGGKLKMGFLYNIYIIVIKIFAPLAIAVVFLNNLGLFKF